MPFVPAVNTALVETRMLYVNQQVENTLWVENDSAWDGASLATLAANIRDWWGGSYSTLVPSSVSLREVVCTDMTTNTGAQATLNGGGLAGLLGSEGMPSNVTLSVSFHTALRGRSFRGRNYIVGIPVGVVEDTDYVQDEYAAACITEYSGLIAAALPGTQHWSVVSRFSGIGGTPPAPLPRVTAVITPITSVAVADQALDSQRRRLPGRGR